MVGVCALLTAEATAKRRITPAGEWLLDNFYLIEEHIRTAERHLPKGYSRELPRLARGQSAGRPRVYDIALETIAHGDGRIDTASLRGVVIAYQTVTALTLGELWAIPIMLRLAAIENLRRVAMRIAKDWAERSLADAWASQMTETADQDPKSLILVIADMARSNPPMGSAFVAELARQLQGRGPALALPLTWIEQRLSESGQTTAQLVQAENQQQAANQVSISNSIGSLRMLSAIDWRDFVEAMSVVEQTLLEDPGGVYGLMDFATRDRYRHATEALARKAGRTESEVARAAIDLAKAAIRSDRGDHAAHVGFYLIDKGLPELERAAGVRLPLGEALRRTAAVLALPLYLGSIALIAAIVTFTLMTLAAGLSVWLLLPFGVASVLAASRLAGGLVNWLATLLVTPLALPRLDFAKGIPSSARTLVVVPTMLTSAAGIEDLVEALEVRFLANRDECLHFALLTDVRDAAAESLPEDESLVGLAATRITELNTKYRGERHGDVFNLFHRPRRWNAQEGTWMGYERKRGKLAALNHLLRGSFGASEHFSHVIGNTAALRDVKYVITLDTDTQLPRDAAQQFVGAMAHPLNRPHFDAGKCRVDSGYGILQPRVAISLPGTSRSRYARMFGGEPGIDPYTRAVSDVYQDLFGEGSFIGKGIYEVDAFERTLAGRFPENRILSHDLIEGCHARAGLLSDVQLFEDAPASYAADVSRRHRWIRGDWQLAAWLLRRVPGSNGEHLDNPLSLLAQWKLFDNLRRSLVPAALTLLLLLGWLALPQAWAMTLAVVGILMLPTCCVAALDLLRVPDEVLLRQHVAVVARSTWRQLLQLTYELACLPYESFYSLDAIVRTMWRLRIAHKRLLEWNPSAAAERDFAARSGNALVATIRTMWIGPALAVATAIYLAASAPAMLAAAAPILLLWLASPALAWWLSQPLARRKSNIKVAQMFFLRAIARRTWAFFDKFVGPQDHWLPPDNYQEYRVGAIAHRTSPTNMGLSLLANLSAYDFGYLTAGQLVERTAMTFNTMATLERHLGHFYNWYDTQTLQPLLPRYISTVDSGNLAGHLLTLRAGLLALADDRILPARLFDGLRDTLMLLADAHGEVPAGRFAAALGEFRREIDGAPAMAEATLATAHAVLTRLNAIVTMLVGGITTASQETQEGEANVWTLALARQVAAALVELDSFAPGRPADSAENPTLRELLRAGNARAVERIAVIEGLAAKALDFARMEYGFLFDKTRHLLSIGYNVDERRLDTGYYDLLASEARLCNFVAIAQGQLPQESWFALGRLLTGTGGAPALLSWSGSMFEYLMPLLVMPTYDNTLLDQTCKAAVARQIEYGKQRGVPWGVSESGYNTVDVHLNYQYRAFGVPGLGLKRGLGDDLVIAPYASAMALMVAPEDACRNLQRLAGLDMVGRFGFYEAIDYTPARQRRGQTSTAVHSFMAHHQGMTLLALAYLILDRPMQQRFEADPALQAVMLLLQERIPRATALFTHAAQISAARSVTVAAEVPIRVFDTPLTPLPEVSLLSNGRYRVMISNAGGGYSRWQDLAVTRWREDATRDPWGSFCYVRDLASGVFWSTAHRPTLKRADAYEAIFSEGRVEFRRSDTVGGPAAGEFETYTEIVVSPEDDIELRRVRITNRSSQRKSIDITSYAEVVIAPPAADALHPAFSKLFVQTEILDERHAILCTRRPRSLDEAAPWMFHQMVAHGADVGAISYETDRMRFLGRNGTTAAPRALIEATKLSGSAGSVLDPIAAIRCALTLAPDESATIDMVSGMAATRDLAVGLIGKYLDRHLADRVFELAWTHSQVVLRQLNATEADAQLYARLASSVIYANAGLRADASVLIRNRRGQSGLWGYAISGDLPVVLLQIGDVASINLVRQMVQAHAYWRLKGLAADLVIWNEDRAGYRQQLQDQIMGLIASGLEASLIDRPGGIFVRHAEQIANEDRVLIQSVARVIISDSRGTLEEQLDRRPPAEVRVPRLVPCRARHADAGRVSPRDDLILGNGLGGFTGDGREYVIALETGQSTPAPWVNVLANPDFGTVVSERGAAYTWCENAHEFRLTPWHNDPVSDACGEAIYLRDEDSGHVWSPAPHPVRAAKPFVVRHGFGYSVFETCVGGISSELWIYVATDAAVKFSVLKLRNESGQPRRLSATAYVDWVLGDLREKSAMHVTTERDAQTGALYARNPYSMDFSDRVAFLDVDASSRSVTGDRREFLGRDGSLESPAAMERLHLSGKVGAGLDPCGAVQVNVELPDGGAREIVFRLGVGRNADDATSLAQRFRGALAAHNALEAVWQHWNHTLGAVQVETPDASLNVMANGWLLYQTLASRIWARSGYYQSGGAFGFRDQLQDVMALVHARPALVREHLLLCASRQFKEGDVQHWWHPPAGRGVRTRCSDDYLWLPLAVCRYVSSCADTGVLDETAPFLEGRLVNPEDDSYYDQPGRSAETASIYQHCVLAIRHGLRFGVHGLPLIGSGDWNDGMNLVGIHGRGESVWLGFFLCAVLKQFAPLAAARGDAAFAAHCLAEATRLRANIEQHGWDGDWYRRAYFDDGTPLGSTANAECRIDSIAQSWSVLSGIENIERSRLAMQSLDALLVRRDRGIVQLLDPPFDGGLLNPGYIRGYVPGVRENGGQYTHGAIWAAMAFAALGDGERAWELLAMINPVNHALTAEGVATYKAEPYVVAADVYGVAPHVGRGGWSWYTGSAGWMYRLLVESLLGLRLEGTSLYVAPCMPPHWREFKIHYRYRETTYHLTIVQIVAGDPTCAPRVRLVVDGIEQPGNAIPLIDDRRDHRVEASCIGGPIATGRAIPSSAAHA